MAPTPRPFIVDPVLTAIAIGYSNPAQTLIADDVLPRVPVGGERFKWMEYPSDEAFTVPDTRVSRRGAPNRVTFTATERDASVEDFGLDDDIPRSDIDSAAAQRAAGRSAYDPEAHSTMMTMGLVLLDREVRVASIAQNPNTYAASRRLALSGTSQFSDYVNSDPIPVIKAALEGTFIYRPNQVQMGQSVWSKLSSHPKLVNAVRGNLTNQGIITKDEFARLFDIKKVLVGESYVNTARRGQAAQMARVWGKHMSFTYIDPMATTDRGVSFGMTAVYGTRIAGRIEDPDVGLLGGIRNRTGERVKELVMAPDVGFLIQNAVA